MCRCWLVCKGNIYVEERKIRKKSQRGMLDTSTYYLAILSCNFSSFSRFICLICTSNFLKCLLFILCILCFKGNFENESQRLERFNRCIQGQQIEQPISVSLWFYLHETFNKLLASSVPCLPILEKSDERTPPPGFPKSGILMA